MPSGTSRPIALAGWLTCVLAAAAPMPHRAPVVLLDVGVEDADGRIVTGLTRDDFEIGTGGAVRPVESFSAGEEQPLSLVLLFDATISMDSMIKRSVVQAGVEKGFVNRLSPRDRVHVGSFARTIAISPAFSGNPKALLSAVRKALDPRDGDTFGPSPVWDAVDDAVAVLANAEGRRAVILVTDGRGTGNRLSPEEAGLRAASAGVAVSVLGEDSEMTIRQDGNTGVRVRPGLALERIANVTGGRYLPDRYTPQTPGPILARLLADLHERYTLGFTPPVRDGQPHALDVRVKRPDLKVRVRRMYVAAAGEL